MKYIIQKTYLLFFVASIVIYFPSISPIYAQRKIIMDLEYLEKMYSKNPDSFDFTYELAKKYKAQGKLARALELFKKAHQLKPEHSDVIFHIGLIYSWNGKYNEAIEQFDQVLKLAQHHYDAMLAKSRVLSWQEKRGEALELVDVVIQAVPDYIDAYELKARIATWNADYDKAIQAYNNILELKPDHKKAQIGLINVTAASGDYNSAISEYKKMLQADPNNPLILRELGIVLSWKGEFNEAIRYLTKARELAPDDKNVQQALARVYRWTGRYEEGMTFQQFILSKDPNNTDAIREVAFLYDIWEKYDKAIAWYEKYIKLKGDDPQIHARLGQLYSRSGRIEDAINSLQKTLKMQDNDVNSLILLGRVYSWKQNIDESLSLYKEALRINPKNQEARIGLGRTYFYDNQWDNAVIQFKKALEINPLNQEAMRELQKMKDLKKPHFTTRYDFFGFRDYDQPGHTFSEETKHSEIIQSVDLAVNSAFSLGIQYKQIADQERDADGSLDYELDGDEYSLYSTVQIGRYLTFAGKATTTEFSNSSDNTNTLFLMEKDKKLYTGFIYGRVSLKRWEFLASYAKEPVYPLFRNNFLAIGDVQDAGGSVRYELIERLGLFSSFFNKMYYDQRHRKEYSYGADYEVPFMDGLETRYQYSTISDDHETIHAMTSSYRNEFGDIQYFLSYTFETNSLLKTNNNIGNIFLYYPIFSQLTTHVDLTYEKLRKEDRDETFISKFYVTFYF